MPHPLYVAFVWHQHQPLYKSRSGGQYRLPWVRLHGTKDYLDLVLLLEKYPKLHQTVNLVPSLILQIEDYVAGTAFDPYLALALSPLENLTPKDKRFIVEHFFDGHHRTLIDPHPRYRDLYQQRQDKGWDWCVDYWTHQDFSDLLAWHNLSWFDPLFWDDPAIATWLDQGQNFSLSDRQRIYSKQRDILRQIVPQHRKMQDAGQLEVTTTPYTHPILPLLADTDSGRVAVPQMGLPQSRFQWEEDIPRHLTKARAMYCDRFGREPRGLWPSEQSVSPGILPYVAQQGFQWLISDEAVLGWTIQHFFHRDAHGTVQEPELLYRPYRLETPDGDLAIVFRDHRLSDLVGFTYSGMAPEDAASDLVEQLEAIAHTVTTHQTSGSTTLDQPWLVTIALDGENCWEFYERDGIPFLENLYGQLSNHDGIQLVTVSEFLDQFPPTATLPAESLHSGSWVDGNFTTWIGDPAKNRAWDLLTQARLALARHPEATEDSNPEAWEALYAAEGSDWFWWLGEGHSSNQDAMFDQLFREHVAAVYTALGESIPPEVRRPIEDHNRQWDHAPSNFIHPVIDGRADEQDWDQAGRIEIGGARGTMHRSSKIQRLWYGVDHLYLYLRVDFASGTRLGIDIPPELHLLWYYPDRPMHNSPPPLAALPDDEPANYHFHHHLGINLVTGDRWLQEAGDYFQWHSCHTHTKVGIDTCLEVAIPWEDLREVGPDWSLRIGVILADAGRYVSYVPEKALIPVNVP
ncbi:MAG: glycoside hydrolase [Kaiparowitsia implicata GSE-PSE-MK54-09C]|jgi:alpha-amylase/alpha-mannosidase (GH57 family)|nr:glycoside hydrolase [Kaiparowitsia implicata GSE-PSE-MK54-09C]